MNASLPPVGVNPLPGTGAPAGGQPARNTPASNPINMYGPISMQGEVNGNAGFGVKNSPVPSKMANLRKAVAAKYPSLPIDGAMNLLHSLGLDHGRDMDSFLQTITKAAAGFRIPGLAGAGRAGRGLAGFKSLGSTLAGAGTGLAVGSGEIATGVVDPNMSTEGKASVLGLNTALGAALGNPYTRKRLLMQRRLPVGANAGLATPRAQSMSVRPLTAAVAISN